MQAVHAVVDGERVGPGRPAGQLERALRDPVAVAADGLAEVRAAVRGHGRAGLGDVVLEGLEAEHHVGFLSATSRHFDGLDDAAVAERC